MASPARGKLPSPSSSNGSLWNDPPSLERMVDHFLSAKRSLTSTSQVWRANELVTESRALLEEIAVLNAKNTFVRSGIDEQVNSLRSVRRGVEVIGVEAKKEFDAVLRSLDEANARLQNTLERLRSTRVEPHDTLLRSEKQSTPLHSQALAVSDDDAAAAGPKTLISFVDDAGLTDLNNALRTCIDNTNAASFSLGKVADDFDEKLNDIEETLRAVPLPDADGDERNVDQQALPQLFGSLEEHATEMATLLQSLVRHYDLCITALKHTEGGGEAAEKATGSLPAGLDGAGQSRTAMLEDLYDNADLAPMSEGERKEMLMILEKDASEVDDVVEEIRERGQDMEAAFQQIDGRTLRAREENFGLVRVLQKLSKMGRQIPNYVKDSSDFLMAWNNEKATIEEKMDEMQSLGDFYDGFLTAYEDLIALRSHRRKTKDRMEKIMKDAMKEIEKLYQADMNVRERFITEKGDFLPADFAPELDEDAPWVQFQWAKRSNNSSSAHED